VQSLPDHIHSCPDQREHSCELRAVYSARTFKPSRHIVLPPDIIPASSSSTVLPRIRRGWAQWGITPLNSRRQPYLQTVLTDESNIIPKLCARNSTGRESTSRLGGNEIEHSWPQTANIRHNSLNPILRMSLCQGTGFRGAMTCRLMFYRGSVRTSLLNTERESYTRGPLDREIKSVSRGRKCNSHTDCG